MTGGGEGRALDVRVEHRFAGLAIDFALRTEASAVGLFGPSGAGKSTVLAAMAGLMRPDQARIDLFGTVVVDTASRRFVTPRERRVGIVMQDGWLFPHLSVQHNLAFGMRGASRLSLEDVAQRLEIAHLLDRRPATLSGGERQRIALGRAILSRPNVLLLDEPFAALDRPRRLRMHGIVRDLTEELELPYVLVSHDAHDIEALARHVAIVVDGRVATAGSPADLRDALGLTTAPESGGLPAGDRAPD